MTTLLQAQALTILNQDDGWKPSSNKPHAYASEALQCARKIGLRVMDMHGLGSDGDVAESKPLHVVLAGFLGNHIHALFQQSLKRIFPDAAVEVKWNMGHVSGRADGLYTDPISGLKTIVEIKSLGMWAYTRAVNKNVPAADHVMQAWLSALSQGADQAHLIYVNRACEAKHPAVLEWIIEVDRQATELESDRMKAIVELAEQGVVPATWYNGKLIDDPETQGWPCTWCDYKASCVAAGEDQMPRSNFNFAALAAATSGE